jgi:hypothetical protein
VIVALMCYAVRQRPAKGRHSCRSERSEPVVDMWRTMSPGIYPPEQGDTIRPRSRTRGRRGAGKVPHPPA